MGSLFADIDAGPDYADRSEEKRLPEGNINVGKQGGSAIAADLQGAPVNLGFVILGTIPAWNVTGAVGRYRTFDQTAQFSAAQQMARPGVDPLRSSLDFGVGAATGKPGASGGNPRLDP